MGPDEASKLVLDLGVARAVAVVFLCMTFGGFALLGWVLKRSLNRALAVNGDGRSGFSATLEAVLAEVRDLRWIILQRPCLTERPCPDEKVEELRRVGGR